jgi:hypothetical protein
VARSQVIERIQGAVGAGRRDLLFEVIEVVGVDVVVGQPGHCGRLGTSGDRLIAGTGSEEPCLSLWF